MAGHAIYSKLSYEFGVGRSEIQKELFKELLRTPNWKLQTIFNLVDSRVLRNKRLQPPPGPEGSNGSNLPCVPQGRLAINNLYFKK